MFPIRILLLLSGLVSPTPAAALTFSAALDLAERQAPMLAAQAARIEAARSAAIPADALPDPKVVIGIDNFPVSGPDAGHLTQDFMTMQKIGVMQDFPHPAKRQARKDLAHAAIDRENTQQRLARLIVRREAAKAWVNLFFLEKRITLLKALERENQLFAEVVKAMLVSGKAMPADTVMPREEAAELEDRQDELQRDVAESRAELRQWVGSGADETQTGEAPSTLIDANRLRNHLQVHPELAMFEPMLRMAQAELREAIAAKRSDWGVEFSYGRRGEAFGDMVSLQFTADLPAFPQRRQDPQIAARRSELTRIDAERDSMARKHQTELDSQLAEHAMFKRRLERLRTVWLPLAREKVDLQLAGYRAGSVELPAVLSARREWINQQLKAIEIEGKHTSVAAQLQIFYGEEQP